MAEPTSAPSSSCPICGKPTDPPFKPFCSKRCRDVDLNRWLSGVYAVPVKEEENEDEDPTPPTAPGSE
ncbi:MAG TPA: DNA gyrase inhibitor YacG [Pseudolabrys sp.]|nr:DNA gyrase inhibitor YacG [Pseudolabrys sp.]